MYIIKIKVQSLKNDLITIQVKHLHLYTFGYQTGVGGIDTYGVNHNNFSLRDEIEYQFARNKREQELMRQYNAQGITENYPQYTTNFWGNRDIFHNALGYDASNLSDEDIINRIYQERANPNNFRNSTTSYRNGIINNRFNLENAKALELLKKYP